MKRIALIVNPVSGRGLGLKKAEAATTWLKKHGAEVSVHVTEKAGDATEFARTLTDFDIAVAVGGDGTLREMVEGLDSHVAVGLIPSGTANVVSRDLRISRSPETAARLLLEGSPRPFDLGRANGRLFLAMVGAGFDAAVVQGVCERRDGPITMASYVKPAFSAVRRFKPVSMRITADGQTLMTPAYGVVVSNTRNYGGLFSVTPDAEHGDGQLDFVAQHGRGTVPQLRYALAGILRRRTNERMATYGRGREFRIDADSPVPVQIDGDYAGTTPVTITIEERSVMILSAETSKA